MYTGHGFNEWGIGDVDVLKVGDTYHLFHLFLPNHAYIAHAISKDGLSWTRVQNALFVGDPGAWDDDMLWTMHVSPDPWKEGAWRMFYTGLARREAGRIQRIGLAVSEDLYTWTKIEDGFPLSIEGPCYETGLDEGRQWVSFRDPFYARVGDEGWLLAAGRVKHGPVIRRGCVALLKEVQPGKFEMQPPLYHPRAYDDFEVPSLVRLGGKSYLVGSIREDIKVRYWYADDPGGPYSNSYDNVLMPKGNYAARICDEGDRNTIWNFYYVDSRIKGTGNRLPPPKELYVDRNGELKLKSFSGFDAVVRRRLTAKDLRPVRSFYDGDDTTPPSGELATWLEGESSFGLFLLEESIRHFRVRGTFRLDGQGKCGLALRMNDQTDGYYISLDLFKGLVQARAWGHNPGGGIEEAFAYVPLQANYFVSKGGNEPFALQLIAYGSYIELSLDGEVLLCFSDDRYDSGYLGYYSEGAEVHVDDLVVEELHEPRGECFSVHGTDEEAAREPSL